ncbi:MAG: hypothetical protein NZ992_08560, partial [Candidatus Korarchaeum sp.]|nr:hypothetical protein [Candidatus Korarchaeum sp.]MDW8035018.1 hypothetical protein [Candidatus Korarchaeum sp.]
MLLRRYLIAIILCILSINVMKDIAPSRFMLITPTYDGSGYAVHPDVLYFEHRWPNNRGYRYWMTFTPYPNCSFSYENPSILVSNDAKNWFEPRGLENPIVAPPSEGHYSDPDIFSFGGKLWVFFRWSRGLEERIYAKSSSNGISWNREAIIINTTSESLLSPSVVVEEGFLKMWYIDIRPSPNLLKLRTSNSPEGPWSEPSVCI